jgi:hypothetical protein
MRDVRGGGRLCRPVSFASRDSTTLSSGTLRSLHGTFGSFAAA